MRGLAQGATTEGSFTLGTRRTSVREGERVDASLAGVTGAVSVMLELDASPASRAFGLARRSGLTAARAAGKRQGEVVKRQQAEVVDRLTQPATRARVIYRTKALYSGVAVITDASRVRALAALPGVKAVRRLTPKSVDNSSSVPLIGAPAVWKGRGQTGRGVRIGIIDTGIDYTHADFGGAGTTAAFAAAKASGTFAGTVKVAGGYDFAGDTYAPGEGDDTPEPDANPLDCNGHGSHVAGTAAGLGVNADGSTFAGSYAADIDPATLRIGPGVAPDATLYALKVFGCDGSTNLVGPALDWAADPNQDGDVSDRLDVVNLSLGSSYGSPDDPDAVAANNLAALGTVVVASMGNSGDVYEVGGSPGNATRVIAVAATDDGSDVVDGLRVDSPAGIEPVDPVDGSQDDIFGALRSTAYDWANAPGVLNTEVVTVGDWQQAPGQGNDTDGCDAYTQAQATTLAGKIVLQDWTDGPGRRCTSAARSANARAAGAVGVILGNDQNAFSAGITGDATIPAMVVVKQARDAIRAKLDAPQPVFASLTNTLRNAVVLKDSGRVDQLGSFSSRGIGVEGNVKPDVAAPGVTISSVEAGSGNEGIAESGTSMASPHVAGEAALVRAVNPGWSTEQVKAAIMNTATADVYTGANRTGERYGPERVGAGRVKVADAVDTQTLAYVKDGGGAVSVSFGPVAVTQDTTLSKTIQVANTRAAPSPDVEYTVDYAPSVVTPGVTYTVSPSSVTIPAGATADVTVTLQIVRSQLRHTKDPTVAGSYTVQPELQRSFRTDASGRVVLTPATGTAGPSLRVPVWSAPRAASAMQAAPSVLVGADGSGRLALNGLGVEQGSGQESVLSTVSTLQLQQQSPPLPSCADVPSGSCVAMPDDRSADLRYVGSAADAPYYTEQGLDPFSWDPSGADTAPSVVSFGISAYGPWRTPASYTEFDVMLDTDGDGVADAAVYNTRLADGGDDLDTFVSETVDLRPGRGGASVDLRLLNLEDGSFDTGVFNSDSLTLSVALPALVDAGLVSSASRSLRYWVQSSTVESGLVDAAGSSTAPMTLTFASPGLSAYGDLLNVASTDLPGTALAVRRDAASLGSDRPLGLLLLHHLNVDGERAQVVQVQGPSTTRLTSSSTQFRYGAVPALTAAVSPAGATGTVTFRDESRIMATVRVLAGKAVYRATALARGTHTVTAAYSGNGDFRSSVSPPVRLTVVGLSTSTRLTSSSIGYRYGARPVLTAAVSPTSASGYVVFRHESTIIGQATLVRSRAVLRAPVLPRGAHYLTATYAGSAAYVPTQSPRLVVRVS